MSPANRVHRPVARDTRDRLRITEVFLSLQGESRSVGWPTAFVRLTGCPLRCGYCDTAYAFQGGTWWSQGQVLEQVRAFGVSHVTVTGGEPLAQRACLPLLAGLCEAGLTVSLETSGAVDVSGVDRRVVKVMDLKTPGSGEAGRNRYANLRFLGPRDQIKFVICHRQDYQWSRERLQEFQLARHWEVLFSPSAGQQDAGELGDWILEDRLPVRMQVQLHKVLWGEVAGR